MKNNKIIFFLAALLAASIVVNSCKKETTQASIHSLFTNGTWQLATVNKFTIIGNSSITDTLNTNCDTTQIFTFNGNNCTYTNFHCIDQPTAAGTWSLSTDGLNLYSNITCKDTLPGDSCCTVTTPFAHAQIVSIGLYQMTLQTGDIGNYYGTTTKRTLYRYGFVHITKAAN